MLFPQTFLDLHLPTWVQFGVPMYSLHGTYHYLNIYEIRECWSSQLAYKFHEEHVHYYNAVLISQLKCAFY